MTPFAEILLLADREITAAEIAEAKAHDRARLPTLLARQRKIVAQLLSKNKDNGE